MPRFRWRRSRRRRPPLGFWLLASVVVLAIAHHKQRGHAVQGGGPAAEGPAAEGPATEAPRTGGSSTDGAVCESPGALLAARVLDLDLAEPVTNEELREAWRALRKRARSGKAGEVAALFAAAQLQPEPLACGNVDRTFADGRGWWCHACKTSGPSSSVHGYPQSLSRPQQTRRKASLVRQDTETSANMDS